MTGLKSYRERLKTRGLNGHQKEPMFDINSTGCEETNRLSPASLKKRLVDECPENNQKSIINSIIKTAISKECLQKALSKSKLPKECSTISKVNNGRLYKEK